MYQLLFISLTGNPSQNVYSGKFSKVNHEFNVTTVRNSKLLLMFYNSLIFAACHWLLTNLLDILVGVMIYSLGSIFEQCPWYQNLMIYSLVLKMCLICTAYPHCTSLLIQHIVDTG